MSSTTNAEANGPQHAHPSRRGRRFIAGTVAAGLTLVGLAAVNLPSANAATTSDSAQPLAQSVGNFLDATLGGSTLDSVAALKFATAKAPGTTSVQNPLDATVLNALHLPLTGALQLPQLLGITLGAVNQVAKANVDGSSYGASGAVENSGGVSVGGNNNAFPANATIDLTAKGIAGNSPIPIPGGASLDALGGLKVEVGAVSALASTPVGVDKGSSANYQIAGLKIVADSPLLGGLLGGVLSSVTGVLGQVESAAGALTSSLTGCDFTSGLVPTTITLEDGAVVIDPATAGLTIDLEKLLQVLGLDLNKMAPNTDLISFLLAYLTDPNGLAKGLTGLVNGLVDPLEQKYKDCENAIKAIPVLGSVLTTLLDTLISGQTTLETTLTGLTSQLATAAGANPLKPLADLIRGLVDIGINVQPNGPAGPAGAAYVDHLAATPKQGTAVVPGQTVVRAIEVNVAAGLGSSLPSLPSIPGLGSLPGLGALPLASVNSLAAPSSGLLTLALGNAAAGPSAGAAATSTTSAPPTGPTSSGPACGSKANPCINTGMGVHGGTPVAPLILLLVGLFMAGGGAVAWKVRGRHI